MESISENEKNFLRDLDQEGNDHFGFENHKSNGSPQKDSYFLNKKKKALSKKPEETIETDIIDHLYL
jgi:hypothetical protein